MLQQDLLPYKSHALHTDIFGTKHATFLYSHVNTLTIKFTTVHGMGVVVAWINHDEVLSEK